MSCEPNRDAGVEMMWRNSQKGGQASIWGNFDIETDSELAVKQMWQ